MRKPQLIQQLALCRQQRGVRPSLQNLLDWLHFDDVDELLRRGLPCRLLEAAGGEKVPTIGPYEKGLQLGLRQMATVADVRLLELLAQHLDVGVAGAFTKLGEDDRTRLLLAYALLWGKERPGDGGLEAVDAFTMAHPALKKDLLEVIAYQRARTVPASGIYFPQRTGVLELHANYTREQINAIKLRLTGSACCSGRSPGAWWVSFCAGRRDQV